MTYKRIDRNQKEIVDALEFVQCEVISLASLGRGIPDLLVLSDGKLYVMEIKFGMGDLTPRQVDRLKKWSSVWHTVRTVEDAYKVIGKNVEDYYEYNRSTGRLKQQRVKRKSG